PRRARAPLCAARGSDGPFDSFSTQRSPDFLNECLRAEKAVRCARSPSPYDSTAESCAFAHVRCAFAGERFSVLGSFSRPGMAASRCSADTGVTCKIGAAEAEGGSACVAALDRLEPPVEL